MAYLLLTLGLGMLLVGGDAMIKAVSDLALRLNISPLVVGLVIVGFGTSLPELLASLQAARLGSPGIAIGNVIGSNLANILLVLGITVLITPVLIVRDSLNRDMAALFAATAVCIAACSSGAIGRYWSLLLLGLLAFYLLLVFRTERRRQELSANASGFTDGHRRHWSIDLVIALGGLTIMILGADLFVSSAIKIAHQLGVTETVIGLTVVALGTSLPELVTCAIAAARKQTELALGNVIGSNIFNILGILGTTALFFPLPLPENAVMFDVWAMAAAAIWLGLLCSLSKSIGRGTGISMLCAYAGFISWRIAQGIV